MEENGQNKCYKCPDGKCIQVKPKWNEDCTKQCSTCSLHRCKHVKSCFPKETK